MICQHAKRMPALERAPGVDLMEEIRHSRPVKESWDIKRSYKN
jgi:hypothetical protein